MRECPFPARTPRVGEPSNQGRPIGPEVVEEEVLGRQAIHTRQPPRPRVDVRAGGGGSARSR